MKYKNWNKKREKKHNVKIRGKPGMLKEKMELLFH